RDAQRRVRVVRKGEKRAAVPATRAARAGGDDKEGPVAGPSKEIPAAPPTLGTEVLGEPVLEEEDNGAPVAPEVVEGSGELDSAKSVWRPTDEPATEFERVTRRVGELRELEVGMADYAATCKRELAAMRFELLRLQTMLGETWRLQGTLVEVRREVEEALWEISAFE
ncbi:hypothetical protein C0991_010681, partial [Blastosporella zonata]